MSNESVEDILLRKVGTLRRDLETETKFRKQLEKRIESLEKQVTQFILDTELLRDNESPDREAFLRGEELPSKT